MSARKIELTQPTLRVLEASATAMELTASQVRLRRNGVEFWSATAIPAWTEMTVDLEVPSESKLVRCNGVVVSCEGNRASGYEVSLLFTRIPRQSLARLELLNYS